VLNRLAIVGASGHGKVVADIARASGWDPIDFFDDRWPQITENGEWPIIGDSDKLLQDLAEYDGVIVAIGNCDTRWEKQELFRSAGGCLISLVHPMSCISPSASIGDGGVVMAGAVINADASIGDGCIVNTGAIVEHDCRIGDAVHIAPGAILSGGVSVAAGGWIGVGAVVRQGVSIGEGVTVGAGAVVLKSVANGLTVVGCPAAPHTPRTH
jgi:sugar O-acyltransferase (sialic acid O-acetyltransferase NeuD family)